MIVHLVVVDLGIVGIAEQAGMHEGEVRHVEEVLDCAWPAGLIVIGAAVDLAEAGILPLGEAAGYRALAVPSADPDPVIFHLRLIHRRLGLGGRRLRGMRGEAHAAAFSVIRPAVIGADQRLVLHGAQREARATMHAEVAPGMDPLAHPPQHDVFVEQA